MKKFLIILLVVLTCLFLSTTVQAARRIYPCTSFIDGGAGALDKLADANLADGDGAIVFIISGTVTEIWFHVFDDEVIAAFWNWSPSVEAAGNHRERNGSHEIDSGSGRVYSEIFDPAWLYQIVEGDFDVAIKLNLAVSENYQKAGILFKHETNNSFVEIGRSYNGKQEINCIHTIDSLSRSDSNPYIGNVIYIRMARSENIFICFYSSDGIDWVALVPSMTLEYDEKDYVGIFATHYPSDVQFTAYFDYFRSMSN